MKNIALSIALTLILAACSSGGSVSDDPINLTGTFNGTFESQNGEDSGTISFNLAQEQGSATITGIMSVDPDVPGQCLVNGALTSGTVAGFSVNLVVGQTTGSVTFQLTSNNAGSLTGTYIASGCSNATGTGEITVNL